MSHTRARRSHCFRTAAPREMSGPDGRSAPRAAQGSTWVAGFAAAARYQTALRHAILCDAPACAAPNCAALKAGMAHSRVCTGASCQTQPAGHCAALLRKAMLAHCSECSIPQGVPCRVQGCDRFRACIAEMRAALSTLDFEVNGADEGLVFSFDVLPAIQCCGPNSSVGCTWINFDSAVRLVDQPDTMVPLLGFLEGSVAMPGLAAALRPSSPAAARNLELCNGRLPAVCSWDELLPLRLGRLVANGALDAANEILLTLFNAPATAASDGEGKLRQFKTYLHAAAQCAVAVLAMQEMQKDHAAEWSALVQRSGLLHRFASLCVSRHGLEEGTVKAVVSVLKVAELSGGALPEFEPARLALLKNWALPAIEALENPLTDRKLAVPAEALPGSFGESTWQDLLRMTGRMSPFAFFYLDCRTTGEEDERHMHKIEVLEAISLLATTPAARSLTLQSGIASLLIKSICDDASGGCQRNRCTSMAFAGVVMRQLCRAPEAVADALLLALLKSNLQQTHGNLQRWIIIYAILPMIRAERSARAKSAAEAQRAACRLSCCVSASSAPVALAALTKAGITAALANAALASPVARKTACSALLLLLGQDAAQFMPLIAADAPRLAVVLRQAAARAQEAATAAARRSRAETQQRRAAKAAAIKARRATAATDSEKAENVDPSVEIYIYTECLSEWEKNGCESDCEAASDDDDADGESAPLASLLVATLDRAAAGAPPPALPAHGSCGGGVTAAAAVRSRHVLGGAGGCRGACCAPAAPAAAQAAAEPNWQQDDAMEEEEPLEELD